MIRGVKNEKGIFDKDKEIQNNSYGPKTSGFNRQIEAYYQIKIWDYHDKEKEMKERAVQEMKGVPGMTKGY